MMWKTLYSARLWLLVLAAAGACDRAATQVVTRPGLSLQSLSLIGLEQSDAVGWPQILLPLDDRLLLWGEGRDVFAFEISDAGLTHEEEESPDLGALEGLTSAGEDGDGKVVLVDWAGRVLAIDRRTGETWRFETLLRNAVSDVAVANGVAYLLLHGGEVDDPAVIGYRLTGEPIGRWGSMPPDGLLQGNLRGGGITACSDGSIFYSYLNSPGIERLVGDATRPLDGETQHFHRLPPREIRRADRQARNSTSVAPMVKLGLTGSRVMALHCTSDGLLLRQVARPARAGAYVEVWDPIGESLIGIVAPVEGLLIGAVDHTLLFATGSKQEGFRLARTMLPSFTGEM
jgi:hypothetical protein